jgi:hypothetical protein
MKSVLKYPRATKIEIPLSEGMAKVLFFAKPYFDNVQVMDRLVYDYNDMTIPFASSKQIGLTKRRQVGDPGPSQITLYEQNIADGILGPIHPVARLSGKLDGFDRRLIIELLVPVPALHTRSVLFIDQLREYAAGNKASFNDPTNIDKETRQLMKSLEEIEQMKKVLVSKGLAEDAAHDQAFKALMPANMQRWMRPDSQGGNAEDRKKAAERFAEIRRLKMKFGGRKTRRRRRKV